MLWAAAFWAAAGSGFVLSMLVRYLVAPVSSTAARVLWMIAWLIGAAVGFWIMQTIPHVPPYSALDRWLVFGVPLVVLAALAAPRHGKTRAWRRAFPLVCTALLPLVLLYQSVYLNSGFTTIKTWLWLGGGAFAFASLDLSTEVLMRRVHCWSVPFSLGASLLAIGTMILLAGYIRGGVTTFAWCGGLYGLMVALLLGTSKCDVGEIGIVAARVAVMSLLAWIAIGYCFGELTWFRAIASSSVPVLLWIPELWGFRKMHAWQRDGLRCLIVGALLFALVWAAKCDFDRTYGDAVKAELATHAELS
jgi:hypothetical protein